MKKPMIRRDESGIAPLMIIGVIAIVAILIFGMYYYVNADDLGDRATSKDIAIIEASGSMTIVYAGGTYVGYGKLNVNVNYDVPTGGWPDFSFAPLGFFEHKMKCEMRCTGPGDYTETTQQTKKFSGVVGYQEIKFDVMKFPVELAGTYTIVMNVEFDGEDLGSTKSTVTVKEVSK